MVNNTAKIEKFPASSASPYNIYSIIEAKVPSLDKKDKEILRELDIDARQSNSMIARKTRLSKSVVNYRIKRMEEEGIITGYSTIFDYSKLGFFMIRIYLDLYERDPKKEEELIEFLQNVKCTGRISRTAGDWDIACSFYVKNVADFWNLWVPFIERFRCIIQEYSTNIVTKGLFFRRAYILGEIEDNSHCYWTRGSAHPVEVDEVDVKIINMLTQNARTPIDKIATITGLGSMAIIYRIKQLMKKEVILGYRLSVDFAKLGYSFYKVNFELEDPAIKNSLTEYCHKHPNIISTVESIGANSDFEFNMEVSSFHMFLQIIDDMKKLFPGKIRNYQYGSILKNYKTKYLPL